MQILFASLIYIIIVIKAINRSISRIWIIIATLDLMILYFYDSEKSFNHHGGVNRIMLVLLVLVEFMLYYMVKGLAKCWKSSNYAKIAIVGSFI